jgi:tRNA(Ile)-lysidine synthase
MQLIKTIRTKWDGKSPLLLGYSGGPDSKALLYALLEANIGPLHVAHVDHGWREESGREAEELRLEAASLGVEFHLHRLTDKRVIDKPVSNLEEKGRLARIRFFRSLFDQIPFQALLLAHHAGDLAETSLKRVFEGARLCSLGGMTQYGVLEGMNVWRPFIHTPKADLLQFLQVRGLKGLVDRTNEDPRFLRGRLRTEIIPFLETSFGKKISSNLQVLSERSYELKTFLDGQIQPLWDSRVQGPWGWCVDLTGVDRVIQRHLLQNKAVGSRDDIDTALNALESGSRLEMGEGLVVERGMFFGYCEGELKFVEPIQLQAGKFSSGDWTMEIEPHTSGIVGPLSWQEVWTGRFEAVLPDGCLELPSSTTQFKEAWRKLGVPLRLRGCLPVLQQGEKMWDLLASPKLTCWKVRFTIALSV